MKHLIAKKLRRQLITKANYGGEQPLLIDALRGAHAPRALPVREALGG
jgi:hypothetical protein